MVVLGQRNPRFADNLNGVIVLPYSADAAAHVVPPVAILQKLENSGVIRECEKEAALKLLLVGQWEVWPPLLGCVAGQLHKIFGFLFRSK